MKSTKVSTLCAVAMTTAIIAILSQIALPSPTGVPFTLQTFAVALVGYILLPKLSFYSVLLYLLLGAIGLPVFTAFRGGLPHLAGLTGGFLWGYLLYAPLCSLGIKKSTGTGFRKMYPAFLGGLVGLLICHTLGVLQYALLTTNTPKTAFFLVSLPYLPKDLLSIAGAYVAARTIRGRLNKFPTLQDFSPKKP